MKNVVIILAAGQGKRMQTGTNKQFIELDEKPILYYTLRAFEQCEFIDDILLIAAPSEVGYCFREVVQAFQFHKVINIIAGGEERYLSVLNGIRYLDSCEEYQNVYIHDGARPFIDQATLLRLQNGVTISGAVVAAVKTKDTIKMVNEKLEIIESPNRNKMWMIQTPQVFRWKIIYEAYMKLDKLLQSDNLDPKFEITDDAGVVSNYTNHKIKIGRAHV